MDSHYFITDWPSEIKPFYIQNYDESPEISKGFDLMHPSMELVSGGQREHRDASLIGALQHQGLNPMDFEFYVDMFRWFVRFGLFVLLCLFCFVSFTCALCCFVLFCILLFKIDFMLCYIMYFIRYIWLYS